MAKANQESPVLHTADGEMPDPSKVGELKRRFSADASLLNDEILPTGLLSILASTALVAGIGYGVYRLIGRVRS
jgi:hypothetical protein